jgi:hypothetical protein
MKGFGQVCFKEYRGEAYDSSKEQNRVEFKEYKGESANQIHEYILPRPTRYDVGEGNFIQQVPYGHLRQNSLNYTNGFEQMSFQQFGYRQEDRFNEINRYGNMLLGHYGNEA